MFFRICSVIVAVLSLTMFQSCATKQSLPELPVALGNNGLLVARLYVLGMRSMENASINIDGKIMASSLRDGYIAVSLEPGEHKLSQIRAEGQLLGSNMMMDDSPIRLTRGSSGPSYIYIPGGSYTIHYTTLAVDRSFRIEPGKVTNLGLIVYLPVLDDPNKKRATVNSSREFHVVAVDNRSEINSFLETNYPELVRSLKDREVLLAPAKYIDAKNLPDLRRAIAFYESRGSNLITTPTSTIVYGRAGTIAVLKKSSVAEAPSVEILDTGTLADIVGAARSGEQFTFLTSDAKLLSWDGNKITQSNLPYRVHPVRMHALGEGGLVVIDNRMRILTSRYQGDQWVNHEAAMIKNARSDVNVVPDSDGVYISLGNQGVPNMLYYLKAGDSTPKLITSPENKPGISTLDFYHLVANDAGLFVIFNKPDYYFWSKARQNWRLYSLPAGKCKPMRINNKGQDLMVECNGIAYHSSNNGASWKGSDI